MTDELTQDATPESASTPEVVARDRGDRTELAVTEPAVTSESGTFTPPAGTTELVVTPSDEAGDATATEAIAALPPPTPEAIPVGETGAQMTGRLERDRVAREAYEARLKAGDDFDPDEIPF